MRVTKFIVFTFLLYFVPPQSKAQSFVKSYYISATGDSVVGTALTDSYTKTSKEIRFKTPNGQETVLNPENIQRVWLFPDWYFEAKNIHFVNLTNTIDDWFFLRVLTRTDSISLYKFEFNQFEGFYVQRKGETIKPLQIFYDFAGNPQLSTYKIGDVVVDTISISDQLNGFDNVGKYRTRKAFLFTLRDFFKECGDKIVQSDYKLTEQDMIQAFNSLASCKQPGRKVPNFFKKNIVV